MSPAQKLQAKALYVALGATVVLVANYIVTQRDAPPVLVGLLTAIFAGTLGPDFLRLNQTGGGRGGGGYSSPQSRPYGPPPGGSPGPDDLPEPGEPEVPHL
jgi:hypothetical protein